MSVLGDKMLEGLDDLGMRVLSLEMAATQGTLPDDVKLQLIDAGQDMRRQIDALRAIAKTIP